MRLLAIALGVLLVLIQHPLWLGKGGWLRVWELDRQLHAQESVNERLAARNSALEAEVNDLRAGKQALEERARYELGMVKPGEIFVQINEATLRRLGPAGGERQVQTASAEGVARR
ncbi:MAG: cell division protein FtsB [Burkholderiales bacterium]|nr:cell division protein FtsB [Burkholderiales bacterium]